MGMAVSCDNALALTVSADNLVGRYDLSVCCSNYQVHHHLLIQRLCIQGG